MRSYVVDRAILILFTLERTLSDSHALEQLIEICQERLLSAHEASFERGKTQADLVIACALLARRSGQQELMETIQELVLAGVGLALNSNVDRRDEFLAHVDLSHFGRSVDISKAIELQRKLVDGAGSSGYDACSRLALNLKAQFDISHQASDGLEALRVLNMALSAPDRGARQVRFKALTLKAGLLAVPDMPFLDPQLSVAIMAEIVLDENCAVWPRIAAMEAYIEQLISSEGYNPIRDDCDALKALLGLTAHVVRLLPRMVELEDSYDARLRLLRSEQAEDFLLTGVTIAFLEGAAQWKVEDIDSVISPFYALQFIETGLALFWSRAFRTSLISWDDIGRVKKFMETCEKSQDVLDLTDSLTEDSEEGYSRRARLSEVMVGAGEFEMREDMDPYARFIHPILPRMSGMLNSIAGNRLAIVITSIRGSCWAFIVTSVGYEHCYVPLHISESEVLKLAAKWDRHRTNARQVLTREGLDAHGCNEEASPRAAGKKRIRRDDDDEEAHKILSTLWKSVLLPIFEQCGLKVQCIMPCIIFFSTDVRDIHSLLRAQKHVQGFGGVLRAHSPLFLSMQLATTPRTPYVARTMQCPHTRPLYKPSSTHTLLINQSVEIRLEFYLVPLQSRSKARNYRSHALKSVQWQTSYLQTRSSPYQRKTMFALETSRVYQCRQLWTDYLKHTYSTSHLTASQTPTDHSREDLYFAMACSRSSSF